MAVIQEEPTPKTGFVEPEAEKIPPPAVRRKGKHGADNAFAYMFLAPQLVGLVVFMLGPLIFAIVLSFSNWDGFGNRSFAGFNNFVTVVSDPQFAQSAINTLWYAVLSVPGTMISAFLVAFLMTKIKGRSIYRAFYFAPVITSSVATAAIWLYLFNPDISPLSSFLHNIGITPPNWLQDPATCIPAFAIVAIWQGLGYQMVMFMAGLENVPASLLEAADIDGASGLQKMLKITIPLLSPTILFLSITSIIGSFQVFDYVFLFMGTTAPGYSRTLVYDLYQKAFVEFNFGQGSAIAMILFLALLALTGLQLVAQKRWVHYTE